MNKENKETLINKLEKGRVDFAYKCIQESLINLKPFELNSVKFLEDAVNSIKDTIINKMKKEIKEEKIKEEKIKDLLDSPYEYSLKDNYNNLTDEEKKVINFYKNLLKNYRSYVKKIPTMILSNGLGQTLAFIKSKSEKGNAYKLIYEQLKEYMRSPYTTTKQMQMPEDKKELIDWVISCDSEKYRYITQEILAFLNWLKRFAEGLIEEEEE